MSEPRKPGHPGSLLGVCAADALATGRFPREAPRRREEPTNRKVFVLEFIRISNRVMCGLLQGFLRCRIVCFIFVEGGAVVFLRV